MRSYMLTDASLNDLVAERARELGLTVEMRRIAEDLEVVVVSAKDSEAALSVLLLTWGNELLPIENS